MDDRLLNELMKAANVEYTEEYCPIRQVACRKDCAWFDGGCIVTELPRLTRALVSIDKTLRHR